MLLEIKAQTQAAIGDIRRLVYDLRPPALDQLGLVGALQEHGARSAGNDLDVQVRVPDDLQPLPAAVEVAAYRIATEALTNVVRHAHARHCTIWLCLADALYLAVDDDGSRLTGRLSARRGNGVDVRARRRARRRVPHRAPARRRRSGASTTANQSR